MKKSEKYQLLAISIGAGAGIFCGWLFGPFMVHFAWAGTLFLDLLRMMILPLVIFSILNGMIGLGKNHQAGPVGLATMVYYLATTFMAVFVGILFVNLIQPGVPGEAVQKTTSVFEQKSAPGFGEMILSLVSGNLVSSMSKMELLPVITFSIIIGLAISKNMEKSGRLIELIEEANNAVLTAVGMIIWMAPLGVFSLIASKIGSIGTESISGELVRLGKYFTTVILGLFFHGFVILPLLLLTLTKRNPLTYFKNSMAALITAFSTASSSATLPVNLECTEKNNLVSAKTAGFTLPIGATVNMDGTALYEAVAAMFIAQVYNIHLSFQDQFVVFLTASLAAIGAAGIPEAGLVTMTIVLSAVHLPVEGISMIIAIDWILDRFRTAINVWGDSIGAAVIDRLYGNKIFKN